MWRQMSSCRLVQAACSVGSSFGSDTVGFPVVQSHDKGGIAMPADAAAVRGRGWHARWQAVATLQKELGSVIAKPQRKQHLLQSHVIRSRAGCSKGFEAEVIHSLSVWQHSPTMMDWTVACSSDSFGSDRWLWMVTSVVLVWTAHPCIFIFTLLSLFTPLYNQSGSISAVRPPPAIQGPWRRHTLQPCQRTHH
jgi:hypothetical protein